MNQAAQAETLLGQFIPLHYHYQMLLDDNRVAGFKSAILEMVPQGSKVAELGGGTGVLSFFAAQKAGKVWCVERNPQMVRIARGYLKLNGVADRVEVIEADAGVWTPPEPVDVVICEMLHSALLREKQIEIIDTFKRNYQNRFPGNALPVFIPEATLLAVQPVQQRFNFHGFNAPIPMFYQPTQPQNDTLQLADPVLYASFQYKHPLVRGYNCNAEFNISQSGELNALRFVTKNILAILTDRNATIDWHNFYLIIPVSTAFKVAAGERIEVNFSYSAGDPIEALMEAIAVRRLEPK